MKHPSTENNLKFKFVWLGQTISKYEVPLDIFNVLNGIYETNFVNLPDAHTQLAGKIGKENSLFFGGAANNKMHKHNLLPPYFLNWFESVFKHYLAFNKIYEYKLRMQSIERIEEERKALGHEKKKAISETPKYGKQG